MSLVEVEFLGTAITSQYGSFSTGDKSFVDAKFAAHLVEDCCVAKYVNQAAVAPLAEEGDVADAFWKEAVAYIKAKGEDSVVLTPVVGGDVVVDVIEGKAIAKDESPEVVAPVVGGGAVTDGSDAVVTASVAIESVGSEPIDITSPDGGSKKTASRKKE